MMISDFWYHFTVFRCGLHKLMFCAVFWSKWKILSEFSCYFEREVDNFFFEILWGKEKISAITLADPGRNYPLLRYRIYYE